MSETIVMNVDPVKLEEIDEKENPWSVEDASVFLNYCCPECDYKNQDLNVFSEHALENHINASALFGAENYDDTKLLFDINKTEEFENDNKDDLFEHMNQDDFELDSISSIKNETNVLCKFCDFTGTTITHIIQHHKESHEDKPPPFYNCDYCDFCHGKNKTVKRHSTMKHGKKFYAYKCQSCGKQMANFKTFKDHLKSLCKTRKGLSIKAENPICEICSIEFSSKQTFKKHNMEKHQSGKQKCCSYCDYKHTSWANLKYHIDCKHPEHGEQKHFCEQCSKGFMYESSCKLHISIKHNSEKNQLKSSSSNNEKTRKPNMSSTERKLFCELCVVEFSSLQILKAHDFEKHQLGKLKCCCYCDFKNASWDYLKKHIDANHPEHGPKKNLCDQCGEGFIFEASCKIHKREKHLKHICTICEIEYSTLRSYKEHLILKHKTSKEVPNLVCEICAFATPSKVRLNKHIRVTHNVEKHKQCPHCEYRTPHNQKLHIHIDGKHPDHGKKKFFCDHCTRSYIFEASLKKHLENLRTMSIQAEKKKRK